MALRQAAVDNHARHRGDVDNRAAPMRQHRPRLGLTGQEDALQIDVDQRLELAFLHRLGRIGIGDSGGVDGEAEWPELGR